MITIALCLSTLNNEESLDLTLTKLREVSDEIFVIDKGSLDKTLNKAALFTSNLFVANDNNFSEILSEVLRKVNSKYILYLNGDEDFSSEDIENLKILKDVYDDSEDYIKFKYDLGDGEALVPFMITRLVKKEKALALKTSLFENILLEGKGISTDIILKKIQKKESLTMEEIYDTPIRVLIGSYIHNKKETVEKFIKSLLNLEKDDLVIDYYFIDDYNDIDTSKLLNDFKINHKNSTIFDVELGENSYICNDENVCDDDLLDRIVRFKNRIINYGRSKAYDYVLILNANILLYPNSLKSLIDGKKDIVSNILWNRCNEKDEASFLTILNEGYFLNNYHKYEELSDEDKLRENLKVLTMIRKPGYYKVNGVGPCVLLSRRAILAGCNFNKIYNTSFEKEEMYFSLRAAVLGFEMFVDTNYPASVIYTLHESRVDENFNDTVC